MAKKLTMIQQIEQEFNGYKNKINFYIPSKFYKKLRDNNPCCKVIYLMQYDDGTLIITPNPENKQHIITTSVKPDKALLSIVAIDEFDQKTSAKIRTIIDTAAAKISA